MDHILFCFKISSKTGVSALIRVSGVLSGVPKHVSLELRRARQA